MTVHPRTPVLVGAGQITARKGEPSGPLPLTIAAVRLAAEDAGLAAAALSEADLLGVVGFTIDAGGPTGRLPIPRLRNPPAAIAQAFSMQPRKAVYTHMGGNTPQALVNWTCDRIAGGENDFAVLTGAEFLGSLMKKAAAGEDLSSYGGGPDGAPERFGDPRDGCTPQEAAHGLDFPTNVYPLFENAYRAMRGRSLEAHAAAMGALFAPMTKVAAQNPLSWFPTARTAEELVTVGPDNRMVGFPYPKYLNSVIQVDQGAALILMASEEADRRGVSAEKRVYLHGCADAHDLWNVSERVNFHSSPAIRACAAAAFDMAQIAPDALDFIDLYSCFPIAVEIACDEIGIAQDDPRGLTVTGGLPYFGGPGNNYAMHGIAEIMARVRARPGSFGLSTANGWYLTKHAMGIYSTTPTGGAWRRPDPAGPQRAVDSLSGPLIVAEPSGRAVIETYTVVHARDRLRMGIVIGRDADGRRFVANTPADEAILKDLQAREGVGRPGTVESFDGGLRNVFTPD